VRADRGKLVIAALTILRAWQVARANERLSLPPFGSFEDWSRRVRGSLVWLDHADPCETVAKVRENDPGREALRAVVMQWEQNLTVGQTYTVQQVIDRAFIDANFHAALLNVAASRSGLLSNDRLGRWLRKVQGKIMNGFSLLQDGIQHGQADQEVTDRVGFVSFPGMFLSTPYKLSHPSP
jgi:putative DNA primase/helicase